MNMNVLPEAILPQDMQRVPLNCEVTDTLPDDALPPYAAMLAAYHRAHAAELRACIADLPVQPGDTVLDMACGDGTYALWLAERVGHTGTVLGVDLAPAFLRIAVRKAITSAWHKVLHFQRGTIDHLPFADHTFDMIWCGQSLGSLPDPVATLTELQRIVRRDGTVAVLENDILHHVLIPWPPDLELTIRQAQLRAAQVSNTDLTKFSVGRHLRAAFRAAGFTACTITPYTATRHAPLDADEYTYLAWYFQDIKTRIWSYIPATDRVRFERLLDPQSPTCLLHRADFAVTYIDLLACGCKG
jgi:ubiquinone/menaquinone biosynthesis C-methylase UbiE